MDISEWGSVPSSDTENNRQDKEARVRTTYSYFESIQLRDDPDLVSQQTCYESVLLVHVPLVSWERSQI